MRKRVLFVVAIAVAVLIVSAVWFYTAIGGLMQREYKPDLIISSPDGQYELVVREFSCLGGAGAEIYIREPGQDKWYNSWRAKQIGSAATDDYYQPFTNGTYYVEWETDRVTIFYYEGLDVENVKDKSTWRGLVTYDLKKD